VIDQAIADAPVIAGQNVTSANDGSSDLDSDQAPASGTGLPQIQVNDRPFRTISHESLEALRTANTPPRLFARAARICCIEETETGRAYIAEFDDAKMRHYLSESADFFELSARGIRREVPPPLDVTRNIQTRNPSTWEFPVLDAVVEAPTLRVDGTILAQPGYDVASRLYLVPSPGLENFEVPDQPSRDHIDIALDVIKDVIADFPFVDQSSQANAIAAMLTAVCRHIIRGPTPLALFDATSQGTGKTLLAEVIAMILTGRPAELMSAPGDPDEWRKQLTSLLMEAPSLVIVDNVSSTMDWSVFCEVSTSETHKDRILGRTKTVTLSVRCSWIATGNNLQLAGDMARRCYWIRMDAGCSDPFRRTGFKHPRLKDYVLERRRELLLALLTLARAWFAAGQPRSSVPPVGSFEHWTEVISGILQYAGVEGFLANSESLFEQSDVERSDWETFLEALEDAFSAVPFTVAELWERLNELQSAARAPVRQAATPGRKRFR
jgi:hypothetical protein